MLIRGRGSATAQRLKTTRFSAFGKRGVIIHYTVHGARKWLCFLQILQAYRSSVGKGILPNFCSLLLTFDLDQSEFNTCP
jgi:hypothetical protein